jgi:hypothetical protein
MLKIEINVLKVRKPPHYHVPSRQMRFRNTVILVLPFLNYAFVGRNEMLQGWNSSSASRESFFDYEYLREFEAKIGTARKVV